MIKPKLKECAGFDGTPHQAYIYKNIDGKKYCKSCALKLEPKEYTFKIHAIKKVSEKQKIKIEEKKEQVQKDILFYLKLWEKKFSLDREGLPTYDYWKWPTCEVCGKRLSLEPNITYFHHILEKRNFPDLRHVEWNIAILCFECHSKYETMPDLVPYLKMKRDELLDKVLGLTEKQDICQDNQK